MEEFRATLRKGVIVVSATVAILLFIAWVGATLTAVGFLLLFAFDGDWELLGKIAGVLLILLSMGIAPINWAVRKI